MFTSIVVALDLEQRGDRSLLIASSLSKLGNLDIELLTVQSPHMPEDADAFELRRRATANGLPPDSYVILQDNEPDRAIASYLEDKPGALLVMATTAKSPLKRQFLGSVSEAVLDRLQSPVLLVGPHVPATTTLTSPTPIVCVDSDELAAAAISVVGSWVRSFGSVSPWVVEVLPASLAQGNAPAESSHARHIADQLTAQGIAASCATLHGDDVGDQLEQFAAQVDNGMLVVTSTNWTDGRAHWHSTARRLVHTSTRPVLVVPALREQVSVADSGPTVPDFEARTERREQRSRRVRPALAT